MWLDNTNGGEFDVPIGALVKMADSGQIQIIDDEGKVHSPVLNVSRATLWIYCKTFIFYILQLYV